MAIARLIPLLAATLLAAFVPAPDASAQGLDRDRAKCESKDNRRETCDVGWPGQTSMVRQLSDTACVEGRTWGATPGKVWVSGGCRAEFGPRFLGQEVKCESSDGKYRECGRGLYGQVNLIRQLSSTACVEGRTFGLRNGAVWVDKGCRGEFRVGESSGRYSVTCSSENGRRTTCAWDPKRGTPALLERLSSSACTSGQSWGYDKKAKVIWVDEGCRARFGVR